MNETMNYVSHSPDETRTIAKVLAEQLTNKHAGKPLVIALEGELGSGKTTFTQAFAQALGVVRNIKSPTFVLMKHYKLETGHYKFLYHLDCYRLQSSKDLKPLALEDIIKDKSNVILIEWAERVKEILPKHHVRIQLEHSGEQTRNISIHGQ